METDIGVPCKLLREHEGKKITVCTNSGETYFGTMLSSDESMNLSLVNVKTTFPSGHSAEMNSVFVKGTKIRYISLPQDAKEAVSFLARQNRSRGRGGFRGGRSRGGRSGGGGRSSSSSDRYDRRR